MQGPRRDRFASDSMLHKTVLIANFSVFVCNIVLSCIIRRPNLLQLSFKLLVILEIFVILSFEFSSPYTLVTLITGAIYYILSHINDIYLEKPPTTLTVENGTILNKAYIIAFY